MPLLVCFLVRHAMIGIGVAGLFLALMVGFDVARLGTLFAGSPDGTLAIGLLTVGLGITFGSVQMGFAVMLMGEKDEPPAGRRIRLSPALARAKAGRRG